MDKYLQDKDEKMLLNALAELHELKQKMEAKEEEKLWSAITFPLTCAEALARLTKDELTAIRKSLDIEGVSSLKKQELIDVLAEQIPSRLPQLLKKWDEPRFNILRQIADNGGRATFQLELYQLKYLRKLGLIFTGTWQGKKTLIMPQEVLEAFRQLDISSVRETLRRNTEWIKLTRGLLYYYGALHLTELETMIKNVTNKELYLWDYYFVMKESQVYDRGIEFFQNGIANAEVWDPEAVKIEHDMRRELAYYPFPKAQLLRAGEPDYIERNPQYLALIDFLMEHYEISRDEADYFVDDCVIAIQNGESVNEQLQYLQEHFEIHSMDVLQAFIDKLVRLHNHTRQWVIKGYSPSELAQIERKVLGPIASGKKADVVDFATRKKVGRNDPCPCGSGKKFKKCCGR